MAKGRVGERVGEQVNKTAEALGDYLKEQRLLARLSLRQLAEQAGVSNPYLSQIERGLRKPSAEVLQQIAKALRISAEQWMAKKTAALVAEGWGGDRLAVFRRTSPGDATSGDSTTTSGAGVPPGTYAVAWHIRFDPGRSDVDAEARQAFKALADALRPRREGTGNTVCVERGALGPLAIARSGRDIALAAGPYVRGVTPLGAGATCAQTARWAADMLRTSKP